MGGKTNLKTSLIMAVLLVGMGLVGNTNVCKSDDAYMVVDDMEDYNDRDDIREVWRDGNADVKWGGTYPYLYLVRGGSSGSNLNVSTAVGSPYQGSTGPIHGGSQAMVLRYDNDGWTYEGLPGEEKWVYDAPYYSEIEANTVGPQSLDVGQNWAGEGVKSLSLWFQGHPVSDGGYDASAWKKYTVYGRGRDIWGRHDEFYFLSQYPFIGAGSIQAQVLSMDNTNPWAKAGVMIREKRTPYSKFAAVFITPGKGVTFQYRDVEDGPATSITKPGVSAPQYVRLVRNISGAFEAKHSDNPFVWQDVNVPNTSPVFPEIAMGTIDDPNIYVGSAVTSHNANQICAADFNDLQISPLPPNWIYGNIGTNDAEQLYVALSDGTTTAVVNHPNPNAATLTEWQEWNIPLTAFTGINLNNVRKVYIGLGDRDNPTFGGSGTVYIDVYQRGPLFLFVDAGAPAGGNGSSWADAFINLQDALAVSIIYGDEIWVAEGTYRPDENTANPGGTGDREATLQLLNGVAIYGGFPSGGGTWEQRDPGAYETILSGDLNGDDIGFTNNGENSYHVVTGSGTDPNAVLDGFTITAGNADGSYPDFYGGGMYNESGSPTVRNCTFTGNSADSGAGMFNRLFDGNPVVSNCIFSGNLAGESGGGMRNAGSNPKVTDCSFIGNEAQNGGGMYNSMSLPTLANCTFSGNTAGGWGGAMCNEYCLPVLTLTNCTLAGNSAASGGGMYNLENSDPTLSNCILWGNSASGVYDEAGQIANNPGSTPVVHYCCIQGWTGSLGGEGNIGDDPLFKDADGPDDIPGTEDDNLELAAGSPCIDAGDNNSVPADIADLDGDGNTAEPIPFDLDGNPRLFDDPITADTGYPPWADAIVDMGAYEFYDHLLAHWKLNERGGTLARDSSGSGHHGTLYGDPNWKPAGGQIGGALQLDGVDDYVDCGNDSSFDITEEITLAAWVNIATIPANHTTIVSKGDSAYRLSTSTEQKKFHFGVCGPPWVNIVNGSIEVLAGEWHHVCGTYDRQTIRLYVDSVLDTTKAATEAIPTNTYSVYIGENSEAIGRYWDGLLDDIRIYNYALSADEIRWLLCARPPRGDLNRDCKVNFLDFAILASSWLDCGLMVPELCAQ